MRAVILSVLVVCCAVAYGGVYGPDNGTSEVPESKWDELAGKVQPFLDQLASEQSQNIKLAKFVSVEFQSSPGGDVYTGNAEFDNNGENVTCKFTLGIPRNTKLENLSITCGEKFYQAVKKQ